MEKLIEHGTKALDKKDLSNIKGGHPILVALGVVTTVVSLGRAIDQAGQWFLDGWNSPR